MDLAAKRNAAEGLDGEGETRSMEANNTPICAEVRPIEQNLNHGKEERTMKIEKKKRRPLPPAISAEMFREVIRLRAVNEEKKDEASRKALHDCVVSYRLNDVNATPCHTIG